MVPLVVNTPEPMLKMKVLAIKDDQEKTVKTLHKIGVLHIDISEELSPADKESIVVEKDRVSSLIKKVTELLSYAKESKDTAPSADIEFIYTRPLHELEKEVDELYTLSNNLHKKTLTPKAELEQLEELVAYLEPLSHHVALTLNDINYTGSYLFSRVLILTNETYLNHQDKIRELFVEALPVTVESKTIVYGIGKAENLGQVNTFVDRIEGKFLEAPVGDTALKDFIRVSSERIASLKKELAALHEELRIRTVENLRRINLLKEVLLAERDRFDVLEKASEAKYVMMVTGWVPKDDIDTTIYGLKDSVDNIYIDVSEPAADEEPPSKLRNKGGFRPFEVIINLFGTPKYREWDPTPIISYSFALFFGLMVCDVIYAIGVALLGKFLLPKFVDDPHTDTFKMFQRLIYICSGVALIGGLLTGQYMGDIPALIGLGDLAISQSIKEALQDPVSFIVIALGIGFIHVNIAHILALAKSIREKNRWQVINKIGLFTLELGIPGILHSMLGANIPGFTPIIYSVLNYFMMAGILLIIVSSIATNGGIGAIMWLFDVTGLLGDIMSYARLAGVGLATYYLGSTFNLISELFRGMIPGIAGIIIGPVIGILIIIVGHVFNVVLTAITGFIHSLRLCFVEFLFKFYEGGGSLYSPFKIKKRTII